MSFPGFTAESSLYRTRVLYRLANVWSTGTWNDASGLVNPAGPMCVNHCSTNLYCCGEGCCHTSNCCDSGGCCDGGVCYGGEDGQAQCCPSDGVVCNGGENDDYCILEDSANCGACAATNPGTSTACASGQHCSNHQCSCSVDTDCGSGQTCGMSDVCECTASGSVACGVTCVPEDDSNCGSCLNRCASGQTCSNHQCSCSANTDCNTAVGQACLSGVCSCPAGSVACGTACVPEDESNCGSCAKTCESGQTCVFGRCQCSGVTCGDECCPSGAECLALGTKWGGKVKVRYFCSYLPRL
jgi:hypothetical protein